MAIAGCIPFIPAGGGPEEILGKNPSLTFHHDHEAVENILNVLPNPELTNALRKILKAKAQLFSIEKFEMEFSDLVAGAIKQLQPVNIE